MGIILNKEEQEHLVKVEIDAKLQQNYDDNVEYSLNNDQQTISKKSLFLILLLLILLIASVFFLGAK